jgi:glutaminyl-tRNA synthetase
MNTSQTDGKETTNESTAQGQIPSAAPAPAEQTHFIRDIIKDDLASKRVKGRIATRFPPEPNGYLHIGHAKSICLNFGLAAEFGGTCNLRFDDTNPSTEDAEYVESIKEDVRWLGFDWEDRLYYASDYFEQLYRFALELIKAGKAYVDSQRPEDIKERRGNYYKPGQDSPYRNRSIEENLALFEKMRQGQAAEGEHVLRAKIDMQHPNLNLRDPLMYRILHRTHHRTGNDWCIYPMYDFAHGQSDALEGITHSICTLEFQDHRPLYDWFLAQLSFEHRPQQIEFARLNLTYTVLSKRRLLKLVEEGHVDGWNDPRMPTLSGMRRRGYTPGAIRKFAERIGVARRDGVVDVSLLEYILREDLNETAPRVMAVLNPLRVIIDNYPEGHVEEFDAPYFPENPERGSRKVPFSREIYIERDDFRLDPPKKWYRLAPGREIRLRWACLITCVDVVTDPVTGEIRELHCTMDPDSRGGKSPDGRKVKGTSHWVSAAQAIEAEVRLYDRLFLKENPLEEKEQDFLSLLNPQSLQIVHGCRLEPSLSAAHAGERFQFERLGYFCLDPSRTADDKPIFNRTISLRDSWAKIEQKLG